MSGSGRTVIVVELVCGEDDGDGRSAVDSIDDRGDVNVAVRSSQCCMAVLF